MLIHSPGSFPSPRCITLRQFPRLSTTSPIPSARATTPHPTSPAQATQSQLAIRAVPLGKADRSMLAPCESCVGVDDGDEGVE